MRPSDTEVNSSTSAEGQGTRPPLAPSAIRPPTTDFLRHVSVHPAVAVMVGEAGGRGRHAASDGPAVEQRRPYPDDGETTDGAQNRGQRFG